MTDEIKKMKCNRCKVLLPDYKFTKKKNDEYQKSCERCRGIQKEDREKNLCPHQKRKSSCAECYTCPHNKRKYDCVKCNPCPHQKIKASCAECNPCPHQKLKGSCVICSHCPHQKLKDTCKKCNDPIKLTIRNMIMSSKNNDKKFNRYDANNFIDKCFLEGLIEEYPTCYYEDCKVELQYVEYQDNLATIERLDNTIGHIKSNCVICCLKCNYMVKSNR